MGFALDTIARFLSEYAYLGLFLILSVGGFGLPIPEEIVLIAAGLFVAQGTTSLGPTLAVSALGMVVGDLLFFAVGWKYGGGALHGVIRRLVPEDRLRHVLARIDRYGLLVVFFGRYLTGIRPAVFLAAGAARIPVRRFMLVDGLSAVVSLFTWVLLGWAAAGWIELVLQWVRSAEHLILAAALAVLLVLFLEMALVRFGWLAAGSTPARVTRFVRIPILVLTVTFAVLVARQHHFRARARLVAAGDLAGPAEVKDLGLLIEALPRLVAPDDEPIEVVFVCPRELLEAALAEAGYRAVPQIAAHGAATFPRPADLFLAAPDGSGRGLAFWRANYVYRRQPIWFGQFVGGRGKREVESLSHTLTRSQYARWLSLGPRLRPDERTRVLWAILRPPASR